MIGFYIKKAFFDAWDHLFSLILLNLGFVLALGLGFLLPGAAGLPVGDAPEAASGLGAASAR